VPTFHFQSQLLGSRVRSPRRLASAWLPALVVSVAGLGGCPPGNGTSPSDAGAAPDAANVADTSPAPDAASEAAPTPVSVTPTTAKVLTCDTQMFGGTPSGGTWTLTPPGSGSITLSGGYAAPLVMPASPNATADYSVGGGSASVAITLATAFPGIVEPVPIVTSGAAAESPYAQWPFEKLLSYRGGISAPTWCPARLGTSS
jgi:hypothetical protein